MGSDLTLKAYIDWNNDGDFSDPDENITEYVENASALIGVDDMTGRVAAVGTCSLVVDNYDRRFSPNYASGPYYGDLLPNRRLKLEAVDDAGTHTLFVGFIKSYEPDPQRFGARRAVIYAEDRLGVIQDVDQIDLPVFYTINGADLIKIILARVFDGGVASHTINMDSANNPSDGDTITVDLITYTFKSSLGSGAYEVKIGADGGETFENLEAAIMAYAGGGTAYTSGLTRQRLIHASYSESTTYDLTIKANFPGAYGNNIILDSDSAAFSTPGTLSGGSDAPSGDLDIEADIKPIQAAGDLWIAGDTNGLTAIEDVTRSAHGFFACKRDGTLFWRGSSWELGLAGASGDHLNDQQAQIVGRLSIDDVYNIIVVTATPRVTTESGVVASSPDSIKVPGLGFSHEGKRVDPNDPPGDNVFSVRLPYKNPTSGEFIGAQAIYQPLPNTDYTVTDFEDGSGYDYTESGRLDVWVALTGSGIEVTFVNTAMGPLFVHDFQVRGVGIRRRDTRQISRYNATSIAEYGKRTPLSIVLPLPVSIEFARALAKYYINRFAQPAYRVYAVTFTNPDADDLPNLFTYDVGDVIELSAYQLGIDQRKFWITGIGYGLDENRNVDVTLHIRRIDDETFWVLGDSELSILGSTTRLAI